MSASAASGSLSVSKKGILARNLKVLRRIDDCVVDVVVALGHAVVYALKNPCNKYVKASSDLWYRYDVEGALFVVRRKGSPEYRIIVINRLNTINLVEDLDRGFLFEESGPFILLGSRRGIKGLWFSQPKDKIILVNTLQGLAPTSVRKGYPECAQLVSKSPGKLLTPAQLQSGRDCGGGYGIRSLMLPSPMTPVQRQTVASYKQAPAKHQGHSDDLVLSKAQLQETLIKLIRNDSFIAILHREYLASVINK